MSTSLLGTRSQKGDRVTNEIRSEVRFGMVPFWLIEDVTSGLVKPTAMTAYLTLLLYADSDRNCWPSTDSLIERSGLSHNTFRNAVKELEAAGAVSVQRRDGTSNLYFLPMLREGLPKSGSLPNSGRGDSQKLGEGGLPKIGTQTITNLTRTNELQPPSPPSQEIAVMEMDEPCDFDSFWDLAVRKKSKGAARRAFTKALLIAPSVVILRAWAQHNERWATWAEGEEVRKYIPHPATWLAQERWMDEALPEYAKGQNGHSLVADALRQATAGMTDEEERRLLFPEMYTTVPSDSSQTVVIGAITDSGDHQSRREE